MLLKKKIAKGDLAYYENGYIKIIDNIFDIMHKKLPVGYITRVKNNKIIECKFSTEEWYKFFNKGDIFMINLNSFTKGIKAMPNKLHFLRPKYWQIVCMKNQPAWCHMWTPKWHKNRGPYISIGLRIIAIYRGY